MAHFDYVKGDIEASYESVETLISKIIAALQLLDRTSWNQSIHVFIIHPRALAAHCEKMNPEVEPSTVHEAVYLDIDHQLKYIWDLTVFDKSWYWYETSTDSDPTPEVGPQKNILEIHGGDDGTISIFLEDRKIYTRCPSRNPTHQARSKHG